MIIGGDMMFEKIIKEKINENLYEGVCAGVAVLAGTIIFTSLKEMGNEGRLLYGVKNNLNTMQEETE